MKRNLLLLLVVLITMTGAVSFAHEDDLPFPLWRINSQYQHLEF